MAWQCSVCWSGTLESSDPLQVTPFSCQTLSPWIDYPVVSGKVLSLLTTLLKTPALKKKGIWKEYKTYSDFTKSCELIKNAPWAPGHCQEFETYNEIKNPNIIGTDTCKFYFLN